MKMMILVIILELIVLLLISKKCIKFQECYIQNDYSDLYHIINPEQKKNALEKEINIKFIKNPNKLYSDLNKAKNPQLFGLLKLSCLKEISVKLDSLQLNKLTDIIKAIMKILKKGYIDKPEIKESIKEVLNKIKGANIINFSRYVDEEIDNNNLNNIINLLNFKDREEINEIRSRLALYNKHIKFFDKKFEKAQKESIFEFCVDSIVIIEREDFEIFEKERKECPNKVDRLLFHGTGIEPVSLILTGYFKKSIYKCYQHGRGVYFTDLLDYCWYYGGKDNRDNLNKIPKVNETFSLIACCIYYNKDGWRQVYDEKYDPQKNEINFALVDAETETLIEPDRTKFVGTEYVIWDLNQICPFLSAKLRRMEYCVIWRDVNFSSKAVYNNEFDEIFKEFLKERMKYIRQMANFNIYAFDNSDEALELVKRKRYNKIILISNVGPDYSGKTFISKARKILKNDVISLFLAYDDSHLDWITKYKNTLFSNSSDFYEKYLQCFEEGKDTYDEIIKLKEKLEEYYDVEFDFNDDFLKFPLFISEGEYSQITI